MRKWLIAAAFLIAASTTVMAQGGKSLPQKIGFINLRKVLDSLPARDSADLILRTIGKEYNDLYVSMNGEYEQMMADYDAFIKGPTPDPLVKELKESNLENLRKRILSFEQRSQEIIQKKQAELYTPILDSIKSATKIVAKAKAYTQVLDISNDSMVYNGNTSDEITNAVIAFMRRKLPKPTKP